MKEKILELVQFLKDQKVQYGDIRVNEITQESIVTENMKVQTLSTSTTYGYGIRVFLDGSMGFAASQDFSKMDQTAMQAITIAKASRLVQKVPIDLGTKPVAVTHYQTPVEEDPFSISKKEKIDLLFSAEKAMREAAPQIFRTHGALGFRKEHKIFADTDGSYITQALTESGGGIDAVAVMKGEMQTRSYPNSARGNYATAGFEFIRSLKLLDHAPRVAQEAVALLTAEECPSGYFDLVIDPTQLTLQIHESVGHPVELDRILGHEAGYAGTSFVQPAMLGSFQYGSPQVTIVADATCPQGLGTFGYDDDGIPAQRIPIITKGIIENVLTSRDTASAANLLPNGTARADGWGRMPIVRMTNISLMPGDYELEDLIAGVDYGFYLDVNKSWSIDDRRVNFQFATEIAYEIKNGKRTGKIFKNPIYTGITPEFWNSCDGVANEKYWQLYGTPNCGKGEPGQVAHVGHGSAPARFRNVKVGVADVQ